MTTKRSGALPVRSGAAPETSLRQEDRPLKTSTSERSGTPGGQYELRFDTTLCTAQRFEIFHRENPHVYRLLTDLARRWKIATGGQNLGIRTLWEQLRWQLATATTGVDYKLNDHFTSFYARLIEHQEPDLRGLFELRKSPEADAWIARVTA
jgi:hypothetical protein